MRAVVRARPGMGVRPSRRARPRRRPAALLALAAIASAPAVGPPAASAAHCGARDGAGSSLRSLRRDMACALATARRRRGLAPLRRNRGLTRAATAHARAMVRRGVFSHGTAVLGRVRAAGFAGGEAAEAIAWGCGGGAAATATLASWLRSPPHRAIALGRRWRSVGIGVARGTPARRCARGATWVLEVGR
jgi:uncharacterized protein YkwD